MMSGVRAYIGDGSEAAGGLQLLERIDEEKESRLAQEGLKLKDIHGAQGPI